MKQFFTLLVLLCTTPFFAQTETTNLAESVQQLLDLEKQQRQANLNQATLRNPFGMDSSYHHIFPTEEVTIKRYFTYNDVGLRMSSLTIKLNPNTNVWENDRKTEIIRDANGHISEVTSWNFGTSDWEFDEKCSYTYDAQGNQIELILQNWNAASQTFINKAKTVDTYDSNNNLLESVFSIWDNGEWVTGYRDLLSYDANGLIEETLRQDFSILTNAFTDVFKTEYSHDGNGYLIKQVTASFDWNYLTWDSIGKIEYFNDNDGRKVAEYISDWNENLIIPNWANQEYIGFTYDGNGNRVEDFYQNYTTSGDWVDAKKWVHFFSIATSTKTPVATSVSCRFQNPIQMGQVIRCLDLESFDEYQFSLFDVSGKLLLEKTFAGEGEIRLPQQMQRGIYFINIKKEGKQVLNEKIILAN